MKKSEALRLEAYLRDMVEGSSLYWWECLKCLGRSMSRIPTFEDSLENYEKALAIVEGRPVFKGDTLYFKTNGYPCEMTIYSKPVEGFDSFTWSPPKPKPKTVMVNMNIEDAELMATWVNHDRVANACRKALEDLK